MIGERFENIRTHVVAAVGTPQISFRTRALSLNEIDNLNTGNYKKFHQETYIGAIDVGDSLMVLETGLNYHKVIAKYQGVLRVGYVSINFNQTPTLSTIGRNIE